MHFGPAAWQSVTLGVVTAIVLRPVLAVLTLLGLAINRVAPALLQRAHLDVIDRPLRVIRPLPGTTVTPWRCRIVRRSGSWLPMPATPIW